MERMLDWKGLWSMLHFALRSCWQAGQLVQQADQAGTKAKIAQEALVGGWMWVGALGCGCSNLE